jgi:tetratricopeptide (TPR) repeat protein
MGEESPKTASEPKGAVFLSYASQDAEAAARICHALRAAGIEVFLDQSELRGGDVWDQKIRREVRECALFVPVISANTASRHEGYFRLEWDLADQRSHMMARSRVFVVPVCLDATTEAAADVPESFRRAQWTRLPAGEAPPAFVERVRGLLSPEPPTTSPSPASAASLVSAAPAAFAPPPHSIAVLPFVNLSGDSARASCETKPDQWSSMWCLALTYEKLGRHADAEAELTKLQATFGDNSAYQCATIYAVWGNTANALEWLDRAVRLPDAGVVYVKTDALMDSRVHAFRGELARAMDYLENSLSTRDVDLFFIKDDPLVSNLKGYPRYREFLRKLNLPE